MIRIDGNEMGGFVASLFSIKFFSYILVLFFIITAITFNIQYLDTQQNKTSVHEEMMYLPSGKFLKGAAICYDEILSDFLWLRTIAYFADHSKTDQDYKWLNHILDITTALDPYYQYPYEFGGIVLATELSNIDSSIEILKKGMKNVERDHKRYWYFPFFIAFNYMFYKNDYKTAAHYLEIAAKFPQAPSYLPLLTARLYANANTPEMAVPFLQEMIKSTDSEELKKQLVQRLNAIVIEKNILALEKAKELFYKKYQKMPESIDQLLEYGMITRLPENPLGGRYYVSKGDYSIKHTVLKDRMRLFLDNKK